MEILTSHRDSGTETLAQLNQYYHDADWKNYVITVHGIKSSMMSIGAVKLSEMAKALEFAGKANDIAYIHKAHTTMTEEFNRVMKVLINCEVLPAKTMEDEVNNAVSSVKKTEISEEIFEQKLILLENVTYEFDASKVIPILDELSAFSYHEVDLEKELKPIYKKVEMSDFMSAYEAVAKIKEKL